MHCWNVSVPDASKLRILETLAGGETPNALRKASRSVVSDPLIEKSQVPIQAAPAIAANAPHPIAKAPDLRPRQTRKPPPIAAPRPKTMKTAPHPNWKIGPMI